MMGVFGIIVSAWVAFKRKEKWEDKKSNKENTNEQNTTKPKPKRSATRTTHCKPPSAAQSFSSLVATYATSNKYPSTEIADSIKLKPKDNAKINCRTFGGHTCLLL